LTGFPFEFSADRASMDNWHASSLFFLEWAGVFPWNSEIVIANPASHAYHISGSTRLTRSLLMPSS
jgi:hypothetical protein